jgi:GSH-dependent disulfide-bond oxidoreductase
VTDLSSFPITGKWPAQHPDRIQLYSLPTPNGVKVSTVLEETGLPYEPHLVRFDANDQMSAQFRSLNPNNKIPAILDPNGPGGKPLPLFESGAILMYLADKAGRFLAPDGAARWETIQWLMFQMGGIGPMFGQWNHFAAYVKEKHPYSIERYTNEVARLSRVLNRRLAETPWLAGDEYSLADIITFPWIRTASEPSPRFDERGYVDLGEYPAIKRWYDEIAARPAVQRGLAVLAGGPAQSPITDAEREITFGKTQFAAR